MVRLPVGAVSSAADEAIALAESCGLYLDPWQKWCVEQILSEDRNGAWLVWTILLILPRQNGKNAVLEVIELAALYLFDEKRIIHSAHLNRTAVDHMARMRDLVRANPDLDAITKFYDTNGKERMVRLDTGAQIEFVTRGQKTMRGGSPSRVVFDEALFLTDEQIQAILPSLSAQSMNDEGAPQFIYTSSAPLKHSKLLHRLRAQAFGPGDFDRMFAAEWGIELPEGGFDDLDITDTDLWYQSNPGMGIRISEEWIRETELSQLSPEAFAIERLGVVFPPEDTDRDPKIPADAWASSTVNRPTVPTEAGDITLAFAVALDGTHASISIAAGSIAKPYIEYVEDRPGVGWLPARFVKLIEDWKPKAIGCNSVGPTAAQVGPVIDAMRRADPPISADRLTQLGQAEYAAACQSLYTAIIEGRAEHLAGQGPLDEAVANAAERRIGEGFGWDIRDTEVPISSLEAATVAASMLPIEAEVESEPLFAFT